MIIGAHESAAGGPYTAVERAEDDDCAALQIFTKNNNRWNQRMWNDEEATTFKEAYAESSLRGLMSHSSYLINLCSSTESTIEKSRVALADELDRCALLDIPYLVLHPGSHTGRGEDEGLEVFIENTRQVYDAGGDYDWSDVTLLFENTAGQGTSLGYRFEHLGRILEGLTDVDGNFGVCYDTCHGHAAGYDLTRRDSYREVWEEFDATVGLDRLQTFHLNDSKNELGSRVDRHDHIGDGDIGTKAFEMLVNDERFADIPAVVETPKLESGETSFAENIRRLRSLRATVNE